MLELRPTTPQDYPEWSVALGGEESVSMGHRRRLPPDPSENCVREVQQIGHGDRVLVDFQVR
jgi:hypothetical protein